MTYWKLFEGAVAEVSTAHFHAGRERAAHLEQEGHRPRLLHAAQLAAAAVQLAEMRGYPPTLSDLGCGDGGLLSLLPDLGVANAWGYDFCPANTAGWEERGVKAEFCDVFGDGREAVQMGSVTVVTEVLEHLSNPFEAVRWIATGSACIVASSPWDENDLAHDECHAWAFDMDSYRALITQAGFRVLRHYQVGRFQLIFGAQI